LVEEFIWDNIVPMFLGGNIYCGNSFTSILKDSAANVKKGKATVFGYYVDYHERFGIVEFDDNGKVNFVEEKPKKN
jgi:glucose-1-phosphate thymidylyltransferase